MERNKQYILALVVVIVALAAGVGYMLFIHVDYETLALSGGTTIEAPKADDVEWMEDESGLKMYTSASRKTFLTSFNTAEYQDLAGALAFVAVRDALFNGTNSVETYGGYDIHETLINGTHFYIVYISNNQTHDNLFIGSQDLNILKHMIDSIRFGDPNVVKNATTASVPKKVVNKNNTNTTAKHDKNKYSEDDLMDAARQGYYEGYSDGYDDSYYDYYDYYDDSGYYDDYEDYEVDEGSGGTSEG